MKSWSVPLSALRGNLVAPMQAVREEAELLNKRQKLVAELEALPRRIAAVDEELATVRAEVARFEPFAIKT